MAQDSQTAQSLIDEMKPRRKSISISSIYALAVLLWMPACKLPTDEEVDHSALVIVLDGLRPDYVTPELMPHLHELGEKGVVYENHHAVYPTVTRVNSPSISTGSYPASHGLMGNSVYYPEISDQDLSTSSADNLKNIEKSTGGNLLTISSAGEVFEKAGKKVLAVSSGSSGSAFLLNHKGLGGGVIAAEVIHPPEIEEHVVKILGPSPPDDRPSVPRNNWVVNAYLEIGLKEIKPDLTFMWLTDPDHTAHNYGIGAPESNRSLREVDLLIGKILSRHKELGLDKRVNIFVTSDHGFSTRDGKADLVQLLEKHGITENFVEVDGRSIYLKPYNEKRLRLIVSMLQSEPTVGAIFTRGSTEEALYGSVPGTFSFNTIHWNHERAADILVSPNWNSDMNAHGYQGHTAWGSVAGHGSSSPFDIHNTLIMSGPDIKRSRKIETPSANVDILPTICFLQGVTLPGERENRILHEGLAKGPDPEEIKVETRVHVAETNGYRLELSESLVEGRRYFNFTQVTRDDAR